jgi:arsenical resistance protein ArsH
MITIQNQSSVSKALQAFNAEGRMDPSSPCDRIVDVCAAELERQALNSI